MPKKGKRRLDRAVKPQVAGLSTTNADNSIENCLSELEALSGIIQEPQEDEATATIREQREQTKPPPSKKHKTTTERSSDHENDRQKPSTKLWDPSLKTLRKQEYIERAHKWNSLLQLWEKHGSYTPGLLPSFETEVARHFQVYELSSWLLKACPVIKMPAFERWLISAKAEEQKRGVAAVDAVLSDVKPYYNASKCLAAEIQEEMSEEEAEKIVKELCRKTQTAVNEIKAQAKRYSGKTPLKKGDKIVLECHDQIYSLLFHCKAWKKPFCIRLAKGHYEKLSDMFWRVHKLRMTKSGKPTKALHVFHYLVMTVLVRYSCLSGGQLLLEHRGGGMQGAIHGKVFQVLSERFDSPLMEGFASPLNAYLPTFYSAYPDLDWHFGSIGNFMECDMQSGCCEANPPFSAGLMEAMVNRIEHCLAKAGKKRSLTFVVVVPTVPEDLTGAASAKLVAGPSFRRMTSNCRAHFVLPAREHGYIEGSQHLRLTRYKRSIFDTSVIIMQSEFALQRPLPEALEGELREAFASLHEEETEQRRQIKEDSDEEE